MLYPIGCVPGQQLCALLCDLPLPAVCPALLYALLSALLRCLPYPAHACCPPQLAACLEFASTWHMPSTISHCLLTLIDTHQWW